MTGTALFTVRAVLVSYEYPINLQDIDKRELQY